jgi:hypothetical protein
MEIWESLFSRITFWNVSQLDATHAASERRKIVALSSAAINWSESVEAELGLLAPSTDHSKILFWCRLLARPVTILRTLQKIARLFPNFRKVQFIPLKINPPTRLRTDAIPTITKAWKNLKLPLTSDGRIPERIAQKARSFKTDCARSMPVHCEIQLLSRYEMDPSLEPSLQYFGCSKKACFLCDRFLSLSPLKPRVRGRHGVCYPTWAVPPRLAESSTMRERLNERLNELCNTIKGQIIRLLQTSSRPERVIVPQSSAVSELGTVDMAHVSQRRIHRKAVEEAGKQHRERMQTL